MPTPKIHKNYPLWIVILSNLISLSIYALGFFIMMKLNLIIAFIYLAYIFILEYRLIKNHCINCYYWGRTCGFGKGKVSALFFKKGDNSKFCKLNITWKDMIADFLVTLIPVVVGIILLLIHYDTILLIAILLLMLLTTYGNNAIRGQLTCKHCRQRELGCPAEKLFNKKGPS
ncbi:MAG: hypothetical protein PHR38_05345 [Bacteroidales bacterium]|nr:hypothetical protein [Bacteroidales bacterium]MDD4712626.1 hypothetical protein [Bacteroidales bacterium]